MSKKTISNGIVKRKRNESGGEFEISVHAPPLTPYDNYIL